MASVFNLKYGNTTTELQRWKKLLSALISRVTIMDIGHLTPRSTVRRHKDDFRLLFLDDLHRPLTTVTGQDVKSCSKVNRLSNTQTVHGSNLTQPC